jgi:hypothetical protein
MLLRIPSSHLYSDDNIIDFFLGFTAVFLFALTGAICCYIRPKEMTLLDAIDRLIKKIDNLLPAPQPVLPTLNKRTHSQPLEAITIDAKPYVQTTFVVPALYIGTPPTSPPPTPSTAIGPALTAATLKRRYSSSLQLLHPSTPIATIKPSPENV